MPAWGPWLTDSPRFHSLGNLLSMLLWQHTKGWLQHTKWTMGEAWPCGVAGSVLRQMKPVRYFGRTAAGFIDAWLSWPLVQTHCMFFIGLILPSVTKQPLRLSIFWQLGNGLAGERGRRFSHGTMIFFLNFLVKKNPKLINNQNQMKQSTKTKARNHQTWNKQNISLTNPRPYKQRRENKRQTNKNKPKTYCVCQEMLSSQLALLQMNI